MRHHDHQGEQQSPAPAAIPTAAVNHMVAAVVSPFTVPPRVKMRSAPRNPAPVTICAVTRDGSDESCCAIASVNPYLLISVSSAALVPTVAQALAAAHGAPDARDHCCPASRTGYGDERAKCALGPSHSGGVDYAGWSADGLCKRTDSRSADPVAVDLDDRLCVHAVQSTDSSFV